MHNERVRNIKHGLVHHSLAAGPAAIRALNQHLPGLDSKLFIEIPSKADFKNRQALAFDSRFNTPAASSARIKDLFTKQWEALLYVLCINHSQYTCKRQHDCNLSHPCTHHVLCSVNHPIHCIIKRKLSTGTSSVLEVFSCRFCVCSFLPPLIIVCGTSACIPTLALRDWEGTASGIAQDLMSCVVQGFRFIGVCLVQDIPAELRTAEELKEPSQLATSRGPGFCCVRCNVELFYGLHFWCAKFSPKRYNIETVHAVKQRAYHEFAKDNAIAYLPESCPPPYGPRTRQPAWLPCSSARRYPPQG
eukprot:1160323-Pelagomonas_calceolata.AAC.3